MNLEKCKTCKNYEDFFGSCKLFYREVYMGEGDTDIQPVRIKDVNKNECEYEKK